MQPRTVLIGFVVMLACLSRPRPQAGQPLWSQHGRGWQKVFSLAGFIGALLIVLNPELLALGLLGDATFFDLLVFALSLQFQTVAIRALQWVRDTSLAALAFMAGRLHRDWVAIAVTLALAVDWALKVRDTVRRISWALA
jgi:hypothetical protein